MNRKKVFAGLFALASCSLLLSSCAGSQKAASANNDCNYARAGAVTMQLQEGRPSQVSGDNLPRNYTVFTATHEGAFFAAASKQGGTAALRLPSGCRQFQLSLSDVMSPQMRERYPDIVSLKGTSADGADLRLDWDGVSMRGQVIENGKSYVLEPHVTGVQKVYLLFSKDDVATPAPRRSFEKSAGSELKKQNAPAADR